MASLRRWNQRANRVCPAGARGAGLPEQGGGAGLEKNLSTRMREGEGGQAPKQGQNETKGFMKWGSRVQPRFFRDAVYHGGTHGRHAGRRAAAAGRYLCSARLLCLHKTC